MSHSDNKRFRVFKFSLELTDDNGLRLMERDFQNSLLKKVYYFARETLIKQSKVEETDRQKKDGWKSVQTDGQKSIKY